MRAARETGAVVFNSIGWPEIAVLALAALFIFGPERLPDLARDAAAGLKKARTAITGVRQQVNDSLGDEFADLRDLDLRKYHPRTFIRTQLLADDEDEPPVAPRSGATASRVVAAQLRDRSVPPPFDVDAT